MNILRRLKNVIADLCKKVSKISTAIPFKLNGSWLIKLGAVGGVWWETGVPFKMALYECLSVWAELTTTALWAGGR